MALHEISLDADTLRQEMLKAVRGASRVDRVNRIWDAYRSGRITQKQLMENLAMMIGRRKLRMAFLTLVPNISALTCHYNLHQAVMGEHVGRLKAALDRAREHPGVSTERIQHAVGRMISLVHEHNVRTSMRMLGAEPPVLEEPLEFCCPITRSRMIDPVIASDGNTYERDAIVQHMGRDPRVEVRSPLTREQMTRVLRPDAALAAMINAHFHAAWEETMRAAIRRKWGC